jgi:hypothetical protein
VTLQSRRRRQRSTLAVLAAIFAGGVLISAEQNGPTTQGLLVTPAGRSALLAQLRDNFWRARELEEQYTYIERRRDVRLGKLGKVSLGPVRTFEVYPSLTPGRTYKRLIAVDDVPLPAEELARRDAEHRANMLWERRRRDEETPAQRAERVRRDQQRSARQRREVDEAFAAFDISPAGHELLEGSERPLLRLALAPRRGAAASSDLVKRLRKFRGTAWVDEAERQLVRIELEAIEAIAVGWGLVGRVGRGSRASYDRRKVDGDVWLPARAHLRASGRTLLVRGFDIDTEWTWTDYRKYSVETAVIGTKVP